MTERCCSEEFGGSYQNHGQTRPDHSTHHGPGRFRKAIKYNISFGLKTRGCFKCNMQAVHLDEVVVDMRSCQSCPQAINYFKNEFRSYSQWD